METLEKGRRWAWEGSPEKVKGGATPRGSGLGSRAAFRGRRKTNPSDCGLAAEKAAPRHCAWSVTVAAPPLEWERGVLGIQESLSARRWLLRGAKPGRAGDPANARAPSAGSLPLEMWSPGRHRQHRRHDRHDRMTGITRELVRDAGSQALPGGASPNLHLTRSRGTREHTALRSTAQARSSDPDSPSSHARRVPAARGRAEVCEEASQAHEPQLTPSTPRNTPPSFRATWGHRE